MRKSGAVDVREAFGKFPRVGHEGMTVGALHLTWNFGFEVTGI